MDVGLQMIFASYGWSDVSDEQVWDEELRLARLAADLGFDVLWRTRRGRPGSADRGIQRAGVPACDGYARAIQAPEIPARLTTQSQLPVHVVDSQTAIPPLRIRT
jgi:hypothetical protein